MTIHNKSQIPNPESHLCSRSEAFQIDPPRMYQPVADHVDRGLRLFERQVSEQRLVDAILRMHVDEQDFGVGRSGATELRISDFGLISD